MRFETAPVRVDERMTPASIYLPANAHGRNGVGHSFV
jgi:hypothetical protein